MLDTSNRLGVSIERNKEGAEIRKHTNRRGDLHYYSWKANETCATQCRTLQGARLAAGIGYTPPPPTKQKNVTPRAAKFDNPKSSKH